MLALAAIANLSGLVGALRESHRLMISFIVLFLVQSTLKITIYYLYSLEVNNMNVCEIVLSVVTMFLFLLFRRVLSARHKPRQQRSPHLQRAPRFNLAREQDIYY